MQFVDAPATNSNLISAPEKSQKAREHRLNRAHGLYMTYYDIYVFVSVYKCDLYGNPISKEKCFLLICVSSA